MGRLLGLAVNCLMVLTIFLIGQWVTDGNFEKMVLFLMSGILTNQFIIMDDMRDDR